MDSLPINESVLKNVIQLLSSLTSPFNAKNNESENNIQEFDDALYHNLVLVRETVLFKDLQKIRNSEDEWKINDLKVHCRWNFVCTCLYLMEILKNAYIQIEDEKAKLLNISQKKTLENSLQFVISLGILQYLIPGVGVPLEEKSKHFVTVKPENLKDFAKYKRLCLVTDTILNFYSVDIFHDIIVSKHLEDVLAALFQLSFAAFKKPVSYEAARLEEPLNLKSLDNNYEIDTMTYSVWTKLESNKKKYKNDLKELQSKLYRPLLIRKYMILLGSKKSPRWMRQNLTNTLTELMLEENGVAATIQSLIEMDVNSPMLQSQCTSVAKLISGIFCNLDDCKIEFLSAQMTKILSNERRKTYDYLLIQVIAVAVTEILQHCQDRASNYLLDGIMKPLVKIDACGEEEINTSINQIYNLCIVPSNNSTAVPIRIIQSVSSVLYFVYVQIKDSVCYLKSLIKELLGKLFLESEGTGLSLLFDSMIFNEKIPEIIQVPLGKKVVLSPNGGVEVVDGKIDFLEVENAVFFLQLMKDLKNGKKLVNSLFIYLLKKYVTGSAEEDHATKRLVIVLLLAELSQDQNTLRYILENAENIIQFVQELLQIHSEENDENGDVIRVCLTFLTMVLYDLRDKKKPVNWKIFTPLIPYLEKLKNSHDPDITLLAEEVYNLIVTRNVIGGAASSNASKSNPLIEEISKSACEKAIEDACDVLLPIRAHALMDLVALIKRGDAETLAKKEKIFCVFKKNLEDKDSFLYLRAIEGLASLTSLKPNDVLPLMCEEFCACTLTENRLKIGEILVRTVKSLNEFIIPHKNLLFNTFLNGVKDKDSLIRASSLSNLGEACFALKSTVGDVLYEVVHCAQAVASSDPDVEPRRAAVYLISSLFRGLKTCVFAALESNLLELYRQLKKIYSTDTDDVVRLQAELSLNVLKENIEESLLRKPVLEKKINVLDRF